MTFLLRMNSYDLIFLTIIVTPIYSAWLMTLGWLVLKDKPNTRYIYATLCILLIILHLFFYALYVYMILTWSNFDLVRDPNMKLLIGFSVTIQYFLCAFLALKISQFEHTHQNIPHITHRVIYEVVSNFLSLVIWPVGLLKINKRMKDHI